MDYTIEKNIPMPPKGSGRPLRYPFDKLEIGDSFVIPTKDYNSVNAAARQYGKRCGMRFTFRKIDDATARVFRIELKKKK